VVVVEIESGTVQARGRAPHTVSGIEGARESDPREWWAALVEALTSAGWAPRVEALAVAGQQHGLVVVDGAGEPLHPAMLWNDTRSAGEATELISELGGAMAWADQIGVVPVASFTVSKWRWLRRHENPAATAARRVLLPHDYLNWRLTGAAATDRGDASGTGWWSTATESYSDRVLDLVQLDRELLPEVVSPNAPAGRVMAAAAAETGVSPDSLVAAGTGDNMGAALALGLRPGQPVVSLGTSGTTYAVSETRVVDPSGTVAGFAAASRGFLPLAATLNCTLAIDRFASWLGIDRDDIADRTDVVTLPYLDGERTPNLPRAAGTIIGLRHTTSAQEILLAAYQGAAASLLEALDAVDAFGSGLDPDAPLILIGGGARGAAWQRVISEMSGRPLLIPDAEELVALGAAVQAASLLTGTPPEETAARWQTSAGRIIEPTTPKPEVLPRLLEVRARAQNLLD
jgi:xylulokinase